MQLGKVIGCIWSTVKNRAMSGQRMLLIQPVTPEMQSTGRQLIALDCTGAGAGELIYWCRGKESSFPFLPHEVSTDATVVGIIDSVHVKRA